MTSGNLLGEPPATLLPDEPAPRELLDAGTPPADVAAAHPTSCAAWATLAEAALSRDPAVESRDPAVESREPIAESRDATIEGYAYARTGYHRGLDALRRNGWKGFGAVPWEHQPNRGFLRALHALAVAAERIGETEEASRCRTLLAESSPTAVSELTR